ncbi:MAG: DUF2239 family protein [Betaproteobacteria bacterium]|nr:DUF2239 family protein [Betaproteobacteria bacterium]
MLDNPLKLSTAFEDHRHLLSGPLVDVALEVKAALESGSSASFLVFDDVTGAVIDLDLHGSSADVVERLSKPAHQYTGRFTPHISTPPATVVDEASEPRGRGRPKLGVVGREVTLLPRQWDWLSTQAGGVSATLRRIVDDAKRSGISREQRRAMQAAAYQFMTAIAGDMTGYEEGIRALFAGDSHKLGQCMAGWPADIRAHAMSLAFGEPVSLVA